jgi:CRISPR-associated protein Cmr4
MRIEDASLLFIYAETPLHPGAGSGTGPIDNPVQREVTTGLPFIPASMVKGTMRAEFDAWIKAENNKEEKERKKKKVNALFGPPVKDPDTGQDGSRPITYASAAAFTDARLLAFPVRVPQGMFIWTTCPLVLHRLQRDMALVPEGVRPAVPEFPEWDGRCALVTDKELLIEGDSLLALEDILIKPAEQNDLVEKLAEWVADRIFPNNEDQSQEQVSTNSSVKVAGRTFLNPEDQYWHGLLTRRLALVPDKVFAGLTSRCTEIVTRTRMESNQKVVEDRGLWTVEYIPSETIFYSTILFTAPSKRAGSDLKSAVDARKFLIDQSPARLQVGGDETVGRGFARMELTGKELDKSKD